MRYVALLRAVNVGGRVVKMDELKTIFAMPGFKNISTYIQSGNVLFDSAETDTTKLEKKIESKLLKALNYEVTVFLKTHEDLAGIIENNPYGGEPEGKNLYLSFLSGAPLKDNIKLLDALKAPEEAFAIIDTACYLLFPAKTYGTTKLSNTNLEKKLKVRATTRNWNTVNKLAALLEDK